MRSLFTFLFLAVATVALSQKRDTSYITADGSKVSTRNLAEYIRIVSQPDTNVKLYFINDYFKNGKIQMEAKATSLSPRKFEGRVTYYFENGNKEAIANYKDGKRDGIQYHFFPNGKPYYTANYTGKLKNANEPERLIVANYDSLGNALVTDGNGYYKGYDTKFNAIDEEGAIKNGQRFGEWKFENSLYNRTENYDENGRIISGTTKTNSTGSFRSYTKNAQNQTIFWYKNDGTTTTVLDSADYIKIVDELDLITNLYNVTELYKSGKIKLIGKSVYDDFAYYEGQVTSYFENGQRSKVNTYKSGYLVDEQYEFFPNGKPYITKRYDHEYNRKTGPNFLIVANYDSLGKANVVEGNGYYKGFDLSFKKINEEGLLKNSKKTGEWIFKTDTNFTRVEIYNNGNFVSGKSTDKNGDVKNYTPKTDHLPLFPGGTVAFNRYLSDFIKYPDYERSKNIQGKVIVQFVVETNGTITNIKVIQSPSLGLSEEAIRIISKSPDWEPGVQYGRPVRATFAVPINFALNR